MVLLPEKFYDLTDYDNMYSKANQKSSPTKPPKSTSSSLPSPFPSPPSYSWLKNVKKCTKEDADRYVKQLAKKYLSEVATDYYEFTRKRKKEERNNSFPLTGSLIDKYISPRPFKAGCGNKISKNNNDVENMNVGKHQNRKINSAVVSKYPLSNSHKFNNITPIKKLKAIDEHNVDDGHDENRVNIQTNIGKIHNLPPISKSNPINDNDNQTYEHGNNEFDDDEDEIATIIAKQDESNEEQEKVHHTLVGLNNLGNTCYMNSIIQTLFSFDFFLDDLIETYGHSLEYFDDNTSDEQSSITFNFIKLYNKYKQCQQIRLLSIENDLALFHNAFCLKIENFQTNEQQDAAEFFTLILDTIRNEIEQIRNRFTSSSSSSILSSSATTFRNPVDRCFEFEILSESICPKCKKPSTKSMEPNYKSNTLHLSLDSDVQISLSKYFKNEISRSKCQDCDEHFVINKRFIKLPKILFIQMLRYLEDGSKDNTEVKVAHTIYLPKKFIRMQSYLMSPLSMPYKSSLLQSFNSNNNTMMMMSKNSKISRKLFSDVDSLKSASTTNHYKQMNLIEDSENNNNNHSMMFDECEKYQLVSVVCHQGPSITCGHYTCYVYNYKDRQWYHCDDGQIRNVQFEQIEKNCMTTAYCYFYASVQ